MQGTTMLLKKGAAIVRETAIHPNHEKPGGRMKAFFTCPTLVLVFSAGLLSTPALAQNSKDVNVVNTPTVNVLNTPGVNVLSMPLVTIDTPVRTPYQITVSTQDWTSNSVNMIVEVPAGNRLVIEHISAFAFMHPEVELSSLAIFPIVNNQSATHFFTLPETAPGFTGSNTYAGGQSVRLYADQSFLARFTKVSVGGSLTLGSASLTVSGYLIPYNSASLAP